ncbi:hypothetical protein WMW72_15755 [Paenibacillus filicis]|uniref:YrzO family protein n=1 Tax=Paenibacillus filicis TaxID=669464 RepID=A0ABU9DMB8_9BACL
MITIVIFFCLAALYFIIRWGIDSSQLTWLQKQQLKELREIRSLLEQLREDKKT